MNKIKTIFTSLIAAIALTATTHAAPLVIMHPDAAQHPNVAIAVEGIEVDGITYTANFHPKSSSFANKFINIWDPNNDSNYADGFTGAAPVFLNNESGAISAYNQIETALSTFLTTHDQIVTDSFFIPIAHRFDNDQVSIIFDQSNADLTIDTMQQADHPKNSSTDIRYVWTTFTPIPEPTSLALLTLTTLPLIIRRKRIA